MTMLLGLKNLDFMVKSIHLSDKGFKHVVL